MKVRGILATQIHIPGRMLALMLGILILGSALLWIVGSNLPPPSFKIDVTRQGVTPVGYPVWRQASDALAQRKYAVLTFDDGPYGNGVDEKILATLRKHHAHAIFFLVCDHLNEQTKLVPSHIEGDGNLIGNHSYNHLHLTTLDSPGLQHQIEDCSVRISGYTGHRPNFFRPPFGQTSAKVAQMVQMAGMTEILWNANSQDSWLTQPSDILHWSLEETSNGSILLMHDKPATAAVLDRVLTSLESRGIRFVLPSEFHEGSPLRKSAAGLK